MEAKRRLLERTPEMQYKYYPTNQQWTWERLGKSGAVDHTRHGSNMQVTGRENDSWEVVSRGKVGQGRLAGGTRGAGGGGAPGGRQGEEAGHAGPTPRGTQTTLDEYRWADSVQESQLSGGQQEIQRNDAWTEEQYNEFMLSLSTLATKARQHLPRPTQ